MWIVDLLLVVPSFFLIAIVTPAHQQSDTVLWLILLLVGIRMDDQLPHRARHDDEPA